MAINDPVGDLITRIRNAQMRRHSALTVPASKLRGWVLDVLADERRRVLLLDPLTDALSDLAGDERPGLDPYTDNPVAHAAQHTIFRGLAVGPVG